MYWWGEHSVHSIPVHTVNMNTMCIVLRSIAKSCFNSSGGLKENVDAMTNVKGAMILYSVNLMMNLKCIIVAEILMKMLYELLE